MKNIEDLNLGFRDAESYKAKDNKELLNSIFLKNSTLDELADQNKYFLIGEKGTGKTAYAVYTSNNKHKNTNSEIKLNRPGFRGGYFVKVQPPQQACSH